jgi:hypothetical protein
VSLIRAHQARHPGAAFGQAANLDELERPDARLGTRLLLFMPGGNDMEASGARPMTAGG